MAELPDWRPLAEVEPPASDGAGRVVGVVASERAAGTGWAPAAAIDLARSWSEQGRRVILVDGAIQAPSLHEAAGLQNREGLSDAALHGASVSRVSHPMDDGSFFLVTAGTPVADHDAVARSGRWHRLTQGMTGAGVTLLVYVRDGYTGTAPFLGTASEIVVLARPGESPPTSVTDLQPLVRAVTAPADAPAGTRPARHAGAGASAVGTPEPAASVATASGDLPTERLRAVPVAAGEGGTGRLVLFLVGALLVAAGLGYLLTSFL
jgi:hypothetical protein